MKNTAINNLTYTGIVTLSQYIGDKKIELTKLNNAGGAALFRFFANCLIGNVADAQADRPAKIKLVARDNGTYNSLSSFVFKRSAERVKTSLGECRVCYSFVIPRDVLDTTFSGGEFGLGLYSAYEEDLSNFIAFCELGDSVAGRNLKNASLVIDWELSIANNKPAQNSAQGGM